MSDNQTITPVVKITEAAYRKIMYWIDKCSYEISGLGLIEVRDGVPWVTDAFLVEQEGSATSTDLKEEAVNRAMYERRNSPGEIKFWWHSHVWMNAFWSGTDKDTIDRLGQHGWFISTVFNKKREMKSAISMKLNDFPFAGHSYCLDDIRTEIISEMPDEFRTALDAEYTSKVQERRYLHQGNYGQRFNRDTGLWEPWDSTPGVHETQRELIAKRELEKNPTLSNNEKSADIVAGSPRITQLSQQHVEYLRSRGMPEADIEELEEYYKGETPVVRDEEHAYGPI